MGKQPVRRRQQQRDQYQPAIPDAVSGLPTSSKNLQVRIMSSLPYLAGKVAVVTGASRGIGKGVVSILGEHAATVYATGGTTAGTPNANRGTIHEVAEAITAAGGFGRAVPCDHSDDGQIKALFERVKAEQGHLDILVNNATTIAPGPLAPPPFWNKSLMIAHNPLHGSGRAVLPHDSQPMSVATSQSHDFSFTIPRRF
jgi:short subunit dehydrogenase